MTAFNPLAALRSPRETVDGYIILPRLIDKVRVQARGELPDVFKWNLLYRGVTQFVGLYDNPAFDPKRKVLPLIEFEHMVRRLMAAPKNSVYKAAMEQASSGSAA